jgi:hypothetical protein
MALFMSTSVRTRAPRKPSVEKAASAHSPVAARPQGVLVLGMHRSGTSAMTRVLNLLGCALPDNLLGAGDGNELGHWESAAAVALNDEILESAGSNWQDWGPINDDWRGSGLRAEMLGRVIKVVENHKALGPLFALKDPRLCRLADLWLESMDAASVEPLVILMLRNPLEVVASLENRDLMAPGYGQQLWLRHVLDAEYFSRGRRRIVCRYDQLVHSWHGVIARVKSGLGVALPRNSLAVHAQVDAFLSSQHRHHEARADEVMDNSGLSTWLRRSFAIMQQWSEHGENKDDYKELDQIRQEFDRAYGAFARLLLPTGNSVQVGEGSRLKRELQAQLTEALSATAEASARIQHAENQQAAAATREAELTFELENVRALLADTQSALETAQQDRAATEQQLAHGLEAQHHQSLQVAELAGRVAATESALLQRQEELTQYWNQLLAAQKSASMAEAAASHERGLRLDSEQRLALAQSDMADLHLQLAAASAAPSPRTDHLFGELAQLTRMLQEQEAATRAAAEAKVEAEQLLAQRTDENGQLLASLQKQESATQAAEAARMATEQKLAARFDEIARLTAMLAAEAGGKTAADTNAQWLRNMMQLTERFPKWWLLMPQNWRRQRQHMRYRRAGLFNADDYCAAYPDVADNGMDPVRHYILHGMSEGRRRL